MFVGMKREFCESEAFRPLTPALSPTTENVLGERAEINWNADPGRPQRLLPLAAPWATLGRPAGAL